MAGRRASGKIDQPLKRNLAQKIYKQQDCAKCHPLSPYPTVEAKPGGRKLIKVTATPLKDVGTDPLYAEYFVKRTSVPGPLIPMFKGTMFEGKEQVPAAIQFLATLTAITSADLDRAAKTPEDRQRLLGDRPLPTLPKTPAELDQLVNGLLVYKATPLAGVWATAPYLHNGSVPSLYELLLPPEERAKSFYLGDREFDPKKAGYKTDAFEGGYKYDTAAELLNRRPRPPRDRRSARKTALRRCSSSSRRCDSPTSPWTPAAGFLKRAASSPSASSHRRKTTACTCATCPLPGCSRGRSSRVQAGG